MFSYFRNRRRRRLLADPFPKWWEAVLVRNVGHYPRLSKDERARLRDITRILVDEKGWEGCGGFHVTDEVKLTVNRNTVPFDEQPPTVASGVRIGTPAATMRGFDEGDFREVGQVMADALGDSPDIDALAARSQALCDKRPLYPGFRGYTTYVS